MHLPKNDQNISHRKQIKNYMTYLLDKFRNHEFILICCNFEFKILRQNRAPQQKMLINNKN